MSTATVTSKGQITIPLDVRQRLGLDAGDRVEFVQTAAGEFTIKPVTCEIRALRGLLKTPHRPVTIEQMSQAIRRRDSKA